ncbi:Acyl-CoA oxidase 2 isoform 1 [Hibiscus syriacus]|uniref:Acyl-CoA oxidase 2 isoform 1 n=1 Tax=Hibiscus syriacus TaxID=106335 RepID=A0A6A2XNU6_HIBSY|nr:uncharacterized protein LOC120173411 [Hibiscus syriacus]KAE8671530.1 Acyl-CoA oxidase 2 isoform 1 [Hibiscus syriacus]
MSGDNFTDGIPKVRPVLCDVTNRSVKRGFSSISEKLGFNSKADADSQLAKQVRVGAENFIKQKSETPRFEPNAKLLPTCSGDIDTSKEDLVSVNDKTSESKEGFELSDGEDTLEGESVAEVGRTLNENSRNAAKDLGVGRLASSKGGCIEWSRLPNSFSQSSKSFELERCVGLKNDGRTNLDANGMLKACFCSICLKAAYILSDLHYQDLKGRISVLKKSQKEARILVQKSSKGNQAEISDQGNAGKSSKLESDLTSQWRSLFLNMEDIFVTEGNQLQSSYTALKDLRENCKIDLERITGMPSEK